MRITGELVGKGLKAGIELVFAGVALLTCKLICSLTNTKNMTELGEKVIYRNDQEPVESTAEEVDE